MNDWKTLIPYVADALNTIELRLLQEWQIENNTLEWLTPQERDTFKEYRYSQAGTDHYDRLLNIATTNGGVVYD